MKTKPIIFLSLFILYGFSGLSADFFVSPNGNDNHNGTREKPFNTIGRALEAVKKVFQVDSDESCTVWLEGGMYPVCNPVVFKSSELNNDEGMIFIKPYPGEKPVISGGISIDVWEKNSDGFWMAQLPVHLKESWTTRELFVNNNRATRARFPNNGYLRVKQVGNDRRTHFFFNEGDFPLPEESGKPELILMHDWSVSRIRVKEIDAENNKLTAVDSIGAKDLNFFNLDNWEKHPRYYLENSIEFLDADYEWFHNTTEGTIYLKLPESVNPQELEIVVPIAEGIVIMEGKEEQPVKNIRFEGITFRHCAWEIPEMGYCGVQACHFDSRPKKNGWDVVPSAIKATWADNCSFHNCSFKNIGTSGIWFATGCRNCAVINSDFSDISGNGMMIGEGRDREVNGDKWWKTKPEQVAFANVIENCRIMDCGKQFFGAVGVWCGLTEGTIIRQNEIAHLPYTGVSVGWMWSPQQTPCRNNTVDGNHIHHIMQILSDGGGIYMLGLQPGSKLVNNRIHDVELNAGRAESNGMFLDEGTTDVVVANNLIYNITKSPLRFHKATTNLVKKNALFCGKNVPAIRYNNTDENNIKKVGNQIYKEDSKKYNRALNEAILEWEKKMK